jgi:DNA-binding CsgD family transcriptional regulator/PAS domain-containing protein
MHKGPPSLSEERAHALIQWIYDAALDPHEMYRVLERFGDVIHGAAVGFGSWTPGGKAYGWDVRFDLDTLQSAYAKFMNSQLEVNPYMARAPHKPVGRVLDRRDFISDAERAESPIYTEVFDPHGYELGAAMILENDPRSGRISCLNVFREPRRTAEFGAAERRIIETFAPHFARALQIHRRLLEAASQRDLSFEVLEHLPQGLIALDGQGEVIRANAVARDILQAKDGLSLCNWRLRAASRTDDRRLQAALQSAVRSGQGAGFGAGGALSVGRPSMLRPLSLLACPLANPMAWLGRIPAAVVFVADPEAEHETPADLLQRLYGLTGAEARLAERLLRGHGLTEAADQLGITRNTANTHLKRLFHKTGVCRQSELVQLVLRGPAGLKF